MKRDAVTKLLATVGTVLVWVPILAPILFTLIRILRGGRLLFNYLMPAELFPAALIGGGLLLWAALRVRRHHLLIVWSLSTAVSLLVVSQGLAIITGLASGERSPEGLWWVLVIACLAGYTLAVLAMAVGAVLLLRDLYRTGKS